ncbi:MAG TPA: hypothetical protein PLQ57_05265 [Saprospiraceae bacterium]|nr:hypothetical protein [Saprospiraceae bacterium]
MKLLLTFGLLVTALTPILAQPEYARNSLTLMAVDFNGKHSNTLMAQFPSLQPPEKFYNNPLQKPVISMAGVQRPVNAELPEFLQYMPSDFIIKMLEEQKVAQQILATWFNRQADGSFNVEVLKQRGLYNANDNDFLAATASKRGETVLMDMGLKLVNQSYVLVYDYFDIMTMDEYYDSKNIDAKSRTSNGYKVKAKSYLFRLDFSEAVAADFFKNYWVGKGDKDLKTKMNAFDQATFTWIPIANQRVEAEVTQYNPDQLAGLKKQKSKEELVQHLLFDVMEKVTPQMESTNEAFRVKAMVSKTKPISAKIGKKEGLSFDQRYFIYENQQRKDGTLFKKRVAVVKSMKVADNRQVTTGQSEASEFYKIFGGKVDNMGMFMEQKNDAGLNLFLGYTLDGMAGYTGRMEYFISKMMGGMVPAGKSGKGLTSLLVYVEGAYDNKKYPNLKEKPFEFTRVSLGIGKDVYLMSAVFFEPYLGYGIEFTDWTVEDEKLNFETSYAEMGLRLGIHLAPSFQLMGSYKYNIIFKTQVKNESTGVTESYDYDEFFKDRIEPGISAGIRFMF